MQDDYEDHVWFIIVFWNNNRRRSKGSLLEKEADVGENTKHLWILSKICSPIFLEIWLHQKKIIYVSTEI
jgi:hypothetical protein